MPAIRFILTGLLLPAGALAQESLTLAEAVSEALVRHPNLAASQQQIAVVEGFRRNAALRPNPRFTFQTENLRAGGVPGFSFARDTDTFAYLTQVVEAGGKRARRVEAAESAVRHSELEREVAARQIASRVSLAYWSAAGAANLRTLFEEGLENFGRIVQYHRDRVREGAMAEADLIRVEVEQYRLAASASDAAREADAAAIALLREMGRADFSRLRLATPEPPVEAVIAPDLRQVLEQRPEMQLARQAVDQARADVRLQHANVRPDPEFLFGYKRAAGFGDTVLAAIQVTLPTANRNQGLIAAADAQVRAAESRLLAQEALLKAEVAMALSEAESRRRTLAETLDPMLHRAEETSRIAQAAYREGGTDLLRLLDAERTRIETQVLYTRALAEYRQSLTALKIATGAMP